MEFLQKYASLRVAITLLCAMLLNLVTGSYYPPYFVMCFRFWNRTTFVQNTTFGNAVENCLDVLFPCQETCIFEESKILDVWGKKMNFTGLKITLGEQLLDDKAIQDISKTLKNCWRMHGSSLNVDNCQEHSGLWNCYYKSLPGWCVP